MNTFNQNNNNDEHNSDKSNFLNDISTKLIASFTEFMYNVCHFAQSISKMDDNEKDIIDSQNEELSTSLYSAYQQSSTSLLNSQNDNRSRNKNSSSKNKNLNLDSINLEEKQPKKILEKRNSLDEKSLIKKEFVETEPFDPDYINTMIRVVFNLIMGIIILLLIASIIFTIREDFARKRQEERDIAMIEIQNCARDYIRNECEPERRVKAAEKFCMEKEICMNQDPTMAVKTTKMTAALAAEILNEFVDPLELKTLIFFFTLLFGMIFVCNCSLRGRSRGDEKKRLERLDKITQRLEKMERLAAISNKKEN